MGAPLGWGEESKAVLLVSGPPLTRVKVCNKVGKLFNFQRRELKEGTMTENCGRRWAPKS